jgi:hypothetical protein
MFKMAVKTSKGKVSLDSQLTDGGEVVSLTRQAPFTHMKILVLISVRG